MEGLKGAKQPMQIGHFESNVIEVETPMKKKDRQVFHLQIIQSLHKNYENLSMEDDKSVLDYFRNFSRIVIKLKSPSAKILRSIPTKTRRKILLTVLKQEVEEEQEEQ
ncbi:unnamed protein product [Spirodela intermedia]|uniref:Uncharacterized protein n=1 Tax=Spirodela intermedia TaxID=51605 RepID=A0A7I8JQC9_SPIIN|nr:unnamed protein product [Spirodela intermedia]CAA6672346.1 unnamed protein product [Spirodela intermedia]